VTRAGRTPSHSTRTPVERRGPNTRLAPTGTAMPLSPRGSTNQHAGLGFGSCAVARAADFRSERPNSTPGSGQNFKRSAGLQWWRVTWECQCLRMQSSPASSPGPLSSEWAHAAGAIGERYHFHHVRLEAKKHLPM
jgi:hypothetical protein